jgi:UDP-glucose 4-epimerase
MATILVTGGTGQIGGYVCSELLRGGHRVVVYDLKPNLENLQEISSKVDLVGADVTDFDELLSVLKSKQVTHIIHLATLVVLESMEKPAKALNVNCVGTTNVFEAARRMDLERVVHASSVAVYGEPDSYSTMMVSEDDHPHCPVDPYSITKFLNEMYGQYYKEAYGLDLLCLRITAAWGPGRYSGYTGQFNDFIRNVATEKASKFPEDFAYRDSKLRWTYVRDTARAFVHSITIEKQKINRGLYNLGNRTPFKALDIVTQLKDILPNSKIQFEETERPTKRSLKIAGPSGLEVDCRRFYEELGFEEKYGVVNGVKEMVNFERSKVGLALA